MWHLVKLPKIGDPKRGFLSFAEAGRTIPFSIKRVYFIYDVGDPSAIRGQHAHRKVEQVFFCLSGKVTFEVDNGVAKQEYTLSRSDEGLYIGPKVWHTMRNFGPSTVLLAVASDYYDEKEYIRDYQESLEFKRIDEARRGAVQI